MSDQPSLISSVADIADKILLSKSIEGLGKTIFFVGAGCSVTANIPASQQLARRMVVEVARKFSLCSDQEDAATAYRSLVACGRLKNTLPSTPLSAQKDDSISWYKVYEEMFETHYGASDDARELFDRVVDEARGAINWAHLCLGELVAQKYVSTVMTTNFDRLVLAGMVRAGVLPLVCDGIESLNRISHLPHHAQLVELHGSRHTYLLRNRREDVTKYVNDQVMVGAIQGLFKQAKTFIVVGYAGREEGVMRLLVGAATAFRDKNLFWIQRSVDENELGGWARDFLMTTRNGGLFVGQDADGFFLSLCEALKIGAPKAIADPLQNVARTLESVCLAKMDNPKINNEIEKAISSLNEMQRAKIRKAWWRSRP